MTDNELNSITLTYSPTLNFVSYSAGVFTLNPRDTDFSCVGTKTITVVLSDSVLTNSYTLTITVTNTAPYF